MAKSGFHRGVRLKGDILRQARLAQGLRQRELAEKAGVGERTVRKAEAGEIIEKHIADYICTVLLLSSEEAIADEATRSRLPSPRMKARRFESDFQKALLDNRSQPFLEWLHPDVEWLCIYSVDPAIYQRAPGKQGAIDLIDQLHQWVMERRVRKRNVTFTQIYRTGDVLYLHAHIRLTLDQELRRKPLQFWSAKLLQFEDGLVRRLEHFWGPLPGAAVRNKPPKES